MQATIREHSVQLAQLCREHHVRRLEVFGSAVRKDFDSLSSDLDFLVEFEQVSPMVYASSYFSLKEALEALFNRPVDLLTPASLDNPYFRASLVASCERVYAA